MSHCDFSLRGSCSDTGSLARALCKSLPAVSAGASAWVPILALSDPAVHLDDPKGQVGELKVLCAEPAIPVGTGLPAHRVGNRQPYWATPGPARSRGSCC